LQSLEQTRARMAGVEIDQLVAAAIWAFSGQGSVVKNLIVAEFWFNGMEEPEQPIARNCVTEKTHDLARLSISPSVNILLSKAGVKAFSKTQVLVAMLHWFATFPVGTRLEILRDYTQHLVAENTRKTKESCVPGVNPARNDRPVA
jgi:hypothetical protein